MTETPELQIHQVRKSFGDNEVLKGVSLDIAKGEVLSIIGASGSGKSTLLRCINLLEIPQSGHMVFKGETIDFVDVSKERVKQAKINRLRTRIGMVFQSFNLWPHLSVLENVVQDAGARIGQK